LVFHEGKLIAAMKNWSVTESTAQVSFSDVLNKAMMSITSGKERTCVITVEPDAGPKPATRTEINCGTKSLTVYPDNGLEEVLNHR